MKQLKVALFFVSVIFIGFHAANAGGWGEWARQKASSAVGSVKRVAGYGTTTQQGTVAKHQTGPVVSYTKSSPKGGIVRRAAGAVATGAKVTVGAGKALLNRNTIKEKIGEINNKISDIKNIVADLKEVSPVVLEKNKTVITTAVGALVQQVHQAVSAIVPYIELKPILLPASTICIQASEIVSDVVKINSLAGNLVGTVVAKELPEVLTEFSGIINDFGRRFIVIGNNIYGKDRKDLVQDIHNALTKDLSENLSQDTSLSIRNKKQYEIIDISTNKFMQEIRMVGDEFSTQIKYITTIDIPNIINEVEDLSGLIDKFVIAPQPREILSRINNTLALASLLIMRVAVLANTAMYSLLSFKSAFGGTIFSLNVLEEIDGFANDIFKLAFVAERLTKILPLPATDFKQKVLKEFTELLSKVTPPDVTANPIQKSVPEVVKKKGMYQRVLGAIKNRE